MCPQPTVTQSAGSMAPVPAPTCASVRTATRASPVRSTAVTGVSPTTASAPAPTSAPVCRDGPASTAPSVRPETSFFTERNQRPYIRETMHSALNL